MTLIIPKYNDEVEMVQNPALGAYNLWRFVKGYNLENSEKTPFLSLFLVLPIVFHKETQDLVYSTQRSSSLMLFASKLGKERDNLLAIQSRTNAMKGLSLRSLSLALNSGVLDVDYDTALVWANQARHTRQTPNLSKKINKIADSSEKLGGWFGRLDLGQIATTLAVRF